MQHGKTWKDQDKPRVEREPKPAPKGGHHNLIREALEELEEENDGRTADQEAE